MAITVRDLLDRGILDALACLFPTEASRSALLDQIGFPSNKRPVDDADLDATGFWLAVCDLLEAGVVPLGLESLLRAVADVFHDLVDPTGVCRTTDPQRIEPVDEFDSWAFLPTSGVKRAEVRAEEITSLHDAAPVDTSGAGFSYAFYSKAADNVPPATAHPEELAGARPEAAEDLPAPRYLNAQMPQRIRRNQWVALWARVALGSQPAQAALLSQFNVPPEGSTITIIVGAPPDVFEMDTMHRQEVHVPSSGDSNWAKFVLRAVRPGRHRLSVSAFEGGTPLGTLTLEVTCDAGIQTSDDVSHGLPIKTRARESGDMTLQIRYDRRSQIYRFQLIGHTVDLFDEALSPPLERGPDREVEELVEQIRDFVQAKTGYTGQQTRAWLRNRGIELWQELIPEDLKRQFWRCSDGISRLFILSNNDPFPWEILYPYMPGQPDHGFLAERYHVARYVFGRGPASQFDFRFAATVLAGEDLDSAELEVSSFSEAFRKKDISTAPPLRDLDGLLRLLDDGRFNLLHFACHNVYHRMAPAASQVWLGDQPFEPLFLNVHKDRFRSSSPLVFMNACRSAGQGLQYTRHTGWAHKFLEAGAAAFVGTHWEVRDESARVFAEEFYRALLEDGVDLGSAVARARKAIKDIPGDPTWLAYTLYGDPAATVV